MCWWHGPPRGAVAVAVAVAHGWWHTSLDGRTAFAVPTQPQGRPRHLVAALLNTEICLLRESVFDKTSMANRALIRDGTRPIGFLRT
ncbi:hypothetical protein [Nocardiopsis oceani]